MLKRCPKCKIEKEASEYYKSSYTKSGLYDYCKKCSNQMNHERRQYHKEHGPSIFRDSKECMKCHNIKPISQFGNRRDFPDGKMSYCKPCWVIITTNAQQRRFDKLRKN